MHLDVVERRLTELDYRRLTSPSGGRLLYEFVLGSEITEVLELGFAEGTSTAYIAAALHERGEGTVTTIDRRKSIRRRPNVHELVRRVGVEQHVRPIFAERSYNWELMRLLEEQALGDRTRPCFDFCFFDGAHTWEADGFAFCLADQLLRGDRWVLFDDLHWTLGASPSRTPAKLAAVPSIEADTPQVRKVFDLLVRRHPAYDGFRIMGRYAWAYKQPDDGGRGRNRDSVDRLISLETKRALALGRWEPTTAQGVADSRVLAGRPGGSGVVV